MGLEGTLRSVKRFLKGATLASSIYLSGCATTLSEFTEGEGLTLIGALIGESDDASVRKLAPYVSLLGQMRYQKEVVRGGRTQVNINQQEQAQNNQDNIIYSGNKGTPAEGYVWTNPEDLEDLSVKKIFGSGFSFRWVDYNRNNKLDFEREFIRIQSRFREKEHPALILVYWAEEQSHQDLKVYGPEGRLVSESYIDPLQNKRGTKLYNSERKMIENNFIFDYEIGSTKGMVLGLGSEMVNLMLETFGEGDYSAIWRINGKIMDSISFELIY